MAQWLNGKLSTFRDRTGCYKPYKCDFLRACGTGTMAGYKRKPKLFMELEV